MALSVRSKLIETFWLFCAFNHRGIHNSILGPTLLDLQLLVEKDLDALSYLFLASGLGSMLGSLAAGFLIPRFDLRLQLFLTLAVGCVVVGSIPQVHHLAYMYFMVFVFGLTRGLVVCFVMQIASELWEKKGPPFQFIASGTSVGAILSPLIAEPFLCPYDRTQDFTATNSSEADMVSNFTSIQSVLDYMETKTVCTSENTQVKWAFFFLGCYMLPACLAQLYYWLSYRMAKIEAGPNARTSYVELKHEEGLKRSPVFSLFYVILFVMYVLLSALSATFSAILTVYGVKGPLQMSIHDMVTMTSLFWFGSLGGRLLSSLYTRYFTNFQVICVHLSGLALCAVIFVSLGYVYSEALWVLSFCVGYFSAPYLAGVLAWVTDFLLLHPKINSLCFLASGAGNMIFPFLGGLLFEYAGALSYLYLILSISIGMCVAFTCLKIISKILPLSKLDTDG